MKSKSSLRTYVAAKVSGEVLYEKIERNRQLIEKRKSIGYDTNGDVFEDTYSRFYEFDTHELNNK